MILLQILLVIPAVLVFTPRMKRSPLTIPIVLIAAFVAMLIIGGRPGKTILAIAGAPSITSIALLADAALLRFTKRRLLPLRDRHAILWFMAAAMLLIYPAFLGFVQMPDLYRAGFLAAAPGVLALLGLAAILRGRYGLAGVILCTLLAMDAQLLTSANVLDYLLDPYGGIYATAWAIVRIVKAVWLKLGRTAVDPGALEDAAPVAR